MLGWTEGKTPLNIDCSDADTVGRIYQKMGKAAVSKAMRICQNEPISQEIVQDVFLKLWRSSISFPHEKAAFAWIYRSVHNAGIDFIRSGKKKYEVTFETLPDVPGRSSIEVKTELTTLLSKLPKRDAQILGYTYIDGMTGDEIAELMKVSRKTVTRSVRRSLDFFESQMRLCHA